VVALDGFDIDSKEVTRADYQAFLDVHYDPAMQVSLCHWNTTFQVVTHDPPDCDAGFEPETFPERPVVCIDWCDAAAYCAWVGRRLCGAIGGGSLHEPQLANPASSDPNKSQWQRACSMGGVKLFPYGDTYDKTKCNTQGNGPTDVGWYVDCVGGYPGLFDMSGNVQEWEDSCNNGAGEAASDDGCAFRGGAFFTGKGSGCALDPQRIGSRDFVAGDVGFRCCSK
jgi:formylglycine-generating enzyme required for sulfatase activity